MDGVQLRKCSSCKCSKPVDRFKTDNTCQQCSDKQRARRASSNGMISTKRENLLEAVAQLPVVPVKTEAAADSEEGLKRCSTCKKWKATNLFSGMTARVAPRPTSVCAGKATCDLCRPRKRRQTFATVTNRQLAYTKLEDENAWLRSVNGKQSADVKYLQNIVQHQSDIIQNLQANTCKARFITFIVGFAAEVKLLKPIGTSFDRIRECQIKNAKAVGV